MANLIKFKIDGRECMAEAGTYIVEAARQNGIFIPTLCNMKGLHPKRCLPHLHCQKSNGRLMTSCTTPVTDGIEIEIGNLQDNHRNSRKK